MNDEEVSESDFRGDSVNVTKRVEGSTLIYVADCLGLVIMTDGDGDGDVKSTTPLDFSIMFLRLITLFLRPIIHRSAFSRPWTLLLIFTYNRSRIRAIFGNAPRCSPRMTRNLAFWGS
jgi:hypothetical protein